MQIRNNVQNLALLSTTYQCRVEHGVVSVVLLHGIVLGLHDARVDGHIGRAGHLTAGYHPLATAGHRAGVVGGVAVARGQGQAGVGGRRPQAGRGAATTAGPRLAAAAAATRLAPLPAAHRRR